MTAFRLFTFLQKLDSSYSSILKMAFKKNVNGSICSRGNFSKFA